MLWLVLRRVGRAPTAAAAVGGRTRPSAAAVAAPVPAHAAIGRAGGNITIFFALLKSAREFSSFFAPEHVQLELLLFV